MADAVDNKAATQEPVKTVTLTIDGNEVTVPKGTTVLQAARQIGIIIPTFCWHPKLKPVGSCRMCYVEIEKWPKLQVSCATECMDDMIVHTDSDLVKRGRRAVIEFTLMNHPLDCPTCDKGGECDLQDLTFAHGIDDSRFDFQKYRFDDGTEGSTFDDKRIGPEIILNRNRCILCYRCVRANKQAFGEYDLGAYERGNITEIHPAPGQEVDNPFSGNLVEICPVGALTNTDWRYKIRVWLTQTASSVDPFSSSGTNILFYKEEHQQKIFRVTSRCNDDIDDGWIPDVTRYGYQFAMSDDRLQTPMIKKDGKQVPATWEEALDVVGRRLTEIDEKKGCVCIGGIASPDLDNASLHSISKLIRVGIGSNNLDYRTDYRMLPKEPGGYYDTLTSQPFRIADIDDSDVIVTLGSDLLREHLTLYVRLRKACNWHRSTIFSMNPYRTKQRDICQRELVYTPGTEEILVNAICLAAIENGLVDATKGDLQGKLTPNTATAAAEACGLDIGAVTQVAEALAQGKKVTLFAGEIVSRSLGRDAIAAALCNLNKLFGISGKGQLAILCRYANSKGAQKLGLQPEPSAAVKAKLSELWGSWPEAAPLNTDAMLVHMRKEEINGCLVFGSNPMMMYPDQEFAREGLERLDFLVVADAFETETTELADVVLPMASWAEYDGYYTNLEGRTQLGGRAIKPRHQAKPAHEIAELIAGKLGQTLFESHEAQHAEVKALNQIDATLPLPDEYVEVAPVAVETEEGYDYPLFIGDDPHHCGYLTEKAESLTNFCGEAYLEISPTLARELKIDDGDSVRVESPVGKVIVPARLSKHIRNRVLFAPRNFSSTQVTSLLMRKRRVDWVKISRVES